MPIPQLLFRSIVSMPIAGAALFALALLDPGAARAESCSVDPFGAEVCLPTSEPPPPGEPTPRAADCHYPSSVLWAVQRVSAATALQRIRGDTGTGA